MTATPLGPYFAVRERGMEIGYHPFREAHAYC
jgi:hypothetical protein